MTPVIPQLMRAKLLASIVTGNLPVVTPPGIMLPVGEVAHYVTGAALLMTTYATEYVRATRGSTVRVARGVSFRTSGSRGYHVTVPTNHTIPGTLVVTNRNVSFYSRSIITLPIDEIAAYNYAANFIEFTYPGRVDDSCFMVPDGEMVAATFHAARMRADYERFGPPSQARLAPPPPPSVDPLRAQQDAASAAARKQQEEEAAAERKRQRREKLIERFGEVNAAKIEAKELWVGATKDEVIEMYGHPADISEKVLKTKTKRVYRYLPNDSRTRFGLKITLENDAVVGWDR
jgi:hypothetical protein